MHLTPLGLGIPLIAVLAALPISASSGMSPRASSGARRAVRQQHLPQAPASALARTTVEVVLSPDVQATPIHGRLYLILSQSANREPRLNPFGPGLAPIFAVDIDNATPGRPMVIDSRVPGYPLPSIDDLPSGDYYAQAVFNVFTTFRRADGHTVKFHVDQGEGQRWKIAPGNLFSDPVKVHIDRVKPVTVRIDLSKRIPALPAFTETRQIKQVRIRSGRLSRFWGQDVFLSAYVILPEGFDDHPTARYPAVYFLTNAASGFDEYLGIRDQPPAPALTGAARREADAGYALYEYWRRANQARALLVLPVCTTNFYRGCYGVDSDNAGPFGSAMLQELVPEIERRFRGIGEGWARALYGTGTGAWHALAWQVQHPEMFNGVWAYGPDPIDFRHYRLINIYEDENAYYPNHPFRSEATRPFQRGSDDQIVTTVKQQTTLETVLGSHSRQGEDVNVSFAVFGPVGADGYPQPLWDPKTGRIDHAVAAHWKQFDLGLLLEREWTRIGPHLTGKIHVSVSDHDAYYRDSAAREVERFLKRQGPPYGGTFTYPTREAANPADSERRARAVITREVLPLMLDRMQRTAPAGSDTRSWIY